MAAGERIRSFIAVVVPPEAAGKLRAAQERLKEMDGSVKWVKPDGFHITLKFLGGVERPRLDALWRTVGAAVVDSPRFVMRFRGIGAFPSRARPRVVWAGVTDGAAELVGVAERVERACQEHGFERENRPFRPHLTLGRAREATPSPRLGQGMAELAELELGEALVDRVVLMRSELTREGAIYHQLEQVMLSGEGEADGREKHGEQVGGEDAGP